MAEKLKKELKLLDVYSIAMGTTLSSGFFLLPGLAFAEAGPSMILSYVIAALLVVPPLLAMVELSTAMPRAGGAYYFLDRSMGPLVGTVGGLGTWLVLILKSAFALIGLGAYVGLFFPNFPILTESVVMALLFGLLNLWGAKKTGSLQIALVVGLLIILAGFLGYGLSGLSVTVYRELFSGDSTSIFATAGLVYISYAGLTKVTSVAEEVKDPERNIALGMVLALVTAVVVYGLGTYLLVSWIPADQLSGDLTPVATAGRLMFGQIGETVITVAAIFGFFASANAGILSASRYPLAMSRDRLLPDGLRGMSKRGTPTAAVVLTVLLVIFVLVVFDPTKIAKLAGAFQLLIFALLCAAAIVMRESHIESYDPGFRPGLYPWLYLLGIASSVVIIGFMGSISIAFSGGLLLFGVLWYQYYASNRVERGGAVFHWFARLGELRYAGLDRELRGILKEKGLREEDPFDEIVMRSAVLDHPSGTTFEQSVHLASIALADDVGRSAQSIEKSFLDGTRMGATPVTHSVALPHFRVEGLRHPYLVIARSRDGIHVVSNDPLLEHEEVQDVNAIFYLVSAEDNPGQHLRLLAQIAGRVDDVTFRGEWQDARDDQELREVLIHDERFLTVTIREDGPSALLAGTEVRSIAWPEGTLVALIRREGEVLVPRGTTVLATRDKLTVLGEPAGLAEVLRRYRRR